ncbi:hypothetical protein PCL_02639 [Purpureocillium lilacinum]|uniref:Uncharacterized protein n=1 Tax=Purpureocillium lilacinum TaxID=33203 RepID=A0A2U3DZM9_PURLI|nr:hypothetical protein PCL_02639 [Purpureocillium lilacinum]
MMSKLVSASWFSRSGKSGSTGAFLVHGAANRPMTTSGGRATEPPLKFLQLVGSGPRRRGAAATAPSSRAQSRALTGSRRARTPLPVGLPPWSSVDANDGGPEAIHAPGGNDSPCRRQRGPIGEA